MYTDKTLTLWKCIYTRASGASELRKCWYFYIIKVIFLSIWMGRNNHLQINILKHIWRMHKHDFCGEQSIYTRAILANWKICMHDFFWWGGTWGGTENLWGGPPRSYAPAWMLLFECAISSLASLQLPLLGMTGYHTELFLSQGVGMTDWMFTSMDTHCVAFLGIELHLPEVSPFFQGIQVPLELAQACHLLIGSCPEQ